MHCIVYLNACECHIYTKLQLHCVSMRCLSQYPFHCLSHTHRSSRPAGLCVEPQAAAVWDTCREMWNELLLQSMPASPTLCILHLVSAESSRLTGSFAGGIPRENSAARTSESVRRFWVGRLQRAGARCLSHRVLSLHCFQSTSPNSHVPVEEFSLPWGASIDQASP